MPIFSRKLLLTLTLAFMTALPAPALAEGPPLALELADGDFVLIPHLQYRPRFVVHTGKNFMDGDTYHAFHQRARLGLEVKAWDWVQAKIELQDVRVWGEETNTLGDFSADGFDLHQAYITMTCPVGFFFRIGRQEINFDNQRLIGAVGWSNQARSFDAIHLGYNKGDFESNLFFALLGEKDAFKQDAAGKTIKGSPEDVNLLAFRFKWRGLAAFRPTLVTIFDHIGPKDQNRATLGLFIDGNPFAGFKYSAEFYYQLGSNTIKGVDNDIAAMLAAVRVGYVAQVFMKPGLTVFLDYLSGDDDNTDNKHKVFDTLFATNHKFYGFMDFFLNIPVHTDGYGIMDIGGRAQFSPLEGMLVFVDFHHFEQAVEDPQQQTKTLGNEVDVLVRYKVNKYLSAEAVYGAFIPKLGGSLRKGTKTGSLGAYKWSAFGKETEHFGYLQLNLAL